MCLLQDMENFAPNLARGTSSIVQMVSSQHRTQRDYQFTGKFEALLKFNG
jgi:hypothetical protein